MQLFYEPLATDTSFILNKEEAQHCLKVLRKKKGDQVTIIDGKGKYYLCVITDDNIKNCQLEVLNVETSTLPDRHIHIAISPTKNLDRTEWFVEKAIEIGVSEISFIVTQNSERRHIKLDRLLKKAVSAMKQSLKATLPVINDLVPISTFINEQKVDSTATHLIAYVDDANPLLIQNAITNSEKVLVLIGPEGDFTSEELELALTSGYQKVSLGKCRLRTETAGIVAITILNNV
ncbi:16S rRNA (uracil(1498)-N(3))-methyltransferase [Fulvivirga lutea]|uniref:Ribosomal RNA small subunit methyltransferase E n=1 Tax=Fulvivirga lutea TaxID=2810512 RepID=A0A974WFW2_9BACT|nr:16S rRNA (uracil(1498)-N(3))-methyltransferase [Fulvivirga lutea]QSE96287.1 16S rRNA (uracil(1498)-N(3))-methyltransferase [Fulvivirga lutea]